MQEIWVRKEKILTTRILQKVFVWGTIYANLLAMIYMVSQRPKKMELCRPYRACVEGTLSIRRVSPYAVLCRPFGAYVCERRVFHFTKMRQGRGN